MKKLIHLLICFLALSLNQLSAQVKIGDNPGTINSNSILELESTNKGFLPPRVALIHVDSMTPLSGTVPEGMLVYSNGGTIADGYYFWNGTQWMVLNNASGSTNTITRSATGTLPKEENLVLASGVITLTLPAVTASDNGLTITVKNVGTYTDVVTVIGNSGALMDSLAYLPMPRWFSLTFVAQDGNWNLKERTSISANTLEVSWAASWTTIAEALEFLELYMSGPTVLRLGDNIVPISETIVIDLPYSLTIEGNSYGATTLTAAAGLENSPMFQCISECYFKKLVFDGTTLANYGDNAGEDAIQLLTAGEYHEIKDCTFDNFNRTIALLGAVELWLFENDISNSVKSGVAIAAGSDSGVFFKTSETDFYNCTNGISLLSGSYAKISILNSVFYGVSNDSGIVYTPATFTNFASIFITNNSWNNSGVFTSGFDFSRSDGRDAKVFFENNAGEGDKNPFCVISVINNASTTTLSSSSNYYKANWTNTSSTTTKWTISGNRITYQPQNRRSGWVLLSGSLSVNGSNKTVNVSIVKNGITSTRYGETSLRITSANQPFQFATAIYLSNIGPGDYFEVYCSSANSGDIVTFQDIEWLTETK